MEKAKQIIRFCGRTAGVAVSGFFAYYLYWIIVASYYISTIN